MGASGQVPPKMSFSAGVSGCSSAVDAGIGESHVSRRMVVEASAFLREGSEFPGFWTKKSGGLTIKA